MRHSSSAGKAFHRLAQTSLIATTSAMLLACGGGDSTTAAAPAPAPTPPSAEVLRPLSGGNNFLGTASFGDTIGLQLDSANQQITLRFVDSRFGLAGTIISAYTTDPHGQFLAQAFEPVTGSELPAALKARLPSLTLRFDHDGDWISGSINGLPNLLNADAAPLHGVLTAANHGIAQIDTLAGTYNYLRQEALYTSTGQPGEVQTSAGQISIASDGSLRVCPAQAVSANCTSGITGRLTVETDQTTYPGALAVELHGQRIGRAVVGKRGGNTLISIDINNASGEGFNSGTWTLQTATAPLAADALDGEWLCSHPDTTSTTNRSMRHYVSIGAGVWQTDTIDTDLRLTANTAAPGNTVNGLLMAQWDHTSASHANAANRIVLPLSANTFFYAGSSTPAANAAQAAGFCQRLPEQPLIHTYLTASPASTEPVLIRLGDALPTQPAVGYDQIYYKQGRYRHVKTGDTASTQWQKAFDDLCEDSGMNSTAKNGVTSASRLNDISTFTCKDHVVNYQSLLKTAVVGPKGQLFLTDGHHSFTSLWEAPNSNGDPSTGLAGDQVQMPVMIKGNFKEMNNASFWRTMRAQKFVWLKHPDGSDITPADLPRKLGLSNGLKDDPYRSLVYFTREVGYDKPVNPSEFLEFYWSEWLQSTPRNFKLSSYTLNMAGNGSDGAYMQAIHDAAQLMLNATPTEMIAASGYNAREMGQLTVFGSSAYNDLSTPKPADGKKAGKLAYALEYRASLNGKK